MSVPAETAYPPTGGTVPRPFEPAPLEELLPKIELIETDEAPVESPWHYWQPYLLIAVLSHRWRDRSDFYVGGNMFVYYSLEQARSIVADPVRTTAYKGPDFFYVANVNRFPLRRHWVVWEEDGSYPDLIVECLSPTTADIDLGSKKDLYERKFRTHEYFCFDPDTLEMKAWRLNARLHYRKIKPDERGWLWSEELEAWLGPWTGELFGYERTWLRLYDANGQLVPLPEEAERERAEAEQRRAETERQRADAERQRAEAAEAEAARLKARLAELEGKGARAKGRKRS